MKESAKKTWRIQNPDEPADRPSFFRRFGMAADNTARKPDGAPTPGTAPVPLVTPRQQIEPRQAASEFASRVGNGRVISLRDLYSPPPTPRVGPDEDMPPDILPLPAMTPLVTPTMIAATPEIARLAPLQDATPVAASDMIDHAVAAARVAAAHPRAHDEYQARRLEIEAALLRSLPESVNFENEVVCRLCECFRAEHACLWLVPPDLGAILDWGRKTIIAEAASASHGQNPFTHTPPTREWALQYLDPILRATGAIVFQVPPPAGSARSLTSTTSQYLAISLNGHPGFRWALLFERASPGWSEAEAMLLEDVSTTLTLAFESRMLAKQSIERGTYLNNLLNSSDIAVMVIEQVTPGKPILTMVNQRFRDLFGIPKAKLAGGSHLDFMEMIRPIVADWDQQMAVLEALLADPGAEHIDEMNLVAPDGTTMRILHRYSAPARDGTGHIFGRMFFFRDVTYDKEMERQIIHSQKMDSIGTLAGGVAHDFNNLLTTILGYTELLKRQSKPEDPNHQRYLQIERSASRAAELTGQLLAFSRRSPTILRLFDMNKLIEETHSMLRSTVPATIEMRLAPDPDIPLIEADETQLQQVIINLVINARDALGARKGGMITVSTRHGEDPQATAENAGRSYVVLEVEDNGVGIPKDALHRIFEPFFTTKDVGKGTGLGLAMVYGIIKKHDGFIEVNSAENIGTKFSVFIPATDAARRIDPTPAAVATMRRRPVTIMVVDDESDLREFCADALTDIAEKVITAGNGIEALEAFQRVNFEVDLVVLDLTMPKMAGPECAYIMRTMKPDLKILISSGYGPDVTSDPQLHGHVAGFLPKPYDLNALIAKVEEVLDAPPPKG